MLSPFFDFNDRFRWMDSFERRMDRAMSQPSRDDLGGSMYLRDTGDELVLTADMPGVAEQDIDITIENDILTLRAQSKRSVPAGYKPVRTERAQLQLVKQIELPVRVDADSVAATLVDGVLELKLPKAAEARPRRIPIVGSRPEAKA